jgi:hypothetical protein
MRLPWCILKKMQLLFIFYVTFFSKKVTKNSGWKNSFRLSASLNLAVGDLMSESE